jgi:hypothetical protein
VRLPRQAWAAPGGIFWHIPVGDNVRRARAGADCRLPAWRVATVMMGDIGEEIIEIELEPLPEEIPAQEPAEPVTEPVPG